MTNILSFGMTPAEVTAEAAVAERETLEIEAKRKAEQHADLAMLSKDARYYRTHKAQRKYDTAMRRAIEADAAPARLTDDDKAQILAIYEHAERLTEFTGIEHEVDHIIPLKAVCWFTGRPLAPGPHIASNLRAIPKSLNRLRGNRWIAEGGPVDDGDDDIPW